jgi:hypothetical protein
MWSSALVYGPDLMAAAIIGVTTILIWSLDLLK